MILVIFPLKFPLKSKKITFMGRKGPRAKTKIVLKSVSIVDQLGSMPNLKFQTFLNKNHPNTTLKTAFQSSKCRWGLNEVRPGTNGPLVPVKPASPTPVVL